MSDSYRLRFVGRFVFACEGNGPNPKTVTVMGMDMKYNEDLGSGRHRLLLAAPRFHVQTLGVRRADLTAFAVTKDPSDAAQLFIWDVEGCDVWPGNVAATEITLVDWETIPDIGSLASSTLQRNLATAPLSPCAVASRFRFSAGRFKAIQFDPSKKVSFEPLEQGEPEKDPEFPLPDVVDVDLTVDGPLYLGLKRQHDRAARSIVITPPEEASLGPVVVTISNLCTQGGSEYDREFAAYYDVLEEPPHPRARLIPYTLEDGEMGARADCTGVGTVRY